jgi:hypothetical protein
MGISIGLACVVRRVEKLDRRIIAKWAASLAISLFGLSVGEAETRLSQRAVAGNAAHVEIRIGVDEGEASTRVSGIIVGMTSTSPADADVAPLKLKLFRDVPWMAGDNHARVVALGATHQYILSHNGITPTRAGAGLGPPYPGDDEKWSTWETVVQSAVETATAEGRTYQWEIYNEPNLPLYWAPSVSQFREAWRRAYVKIRALAPRAVIVGPSTGGGFTQAEQYIKSFLAWAKTNQVLPDVVSWHELGADKPWSVLGNVGKMRAYMAQLGIGDRPISINEWGGQFAERQPGVIIAYLAQLERAGIASAARSCWHDGHRMTCEGPHLNGLVIDSGAGGRRSGWWAMKAFADLTGRFVQVAPLADRLYGSAGWDASKGLLRAVLGNPRNVLLRDMLLRVRGIPRRDGSEIAVTLDRLPLATGAVAGPIPISSGSSTVAGGSIDVVLSEVGNYEAILVTIELP